MKKLMVIAVLLVFMTGSAWAVEWNFYGSARVSTFYTNWDNNFLNTPGGGNPFSGIGPDTEGYEHDLNGNARIGANIKASDTISGRFEYGAKSGSSNIRILWGEWDFGKGSLGVGQNYTPLLFPYSNQVYNIYAMEDGDTNMSLFGMLYGKREPMVRLKFGTFQIAAVKPRLLVNHDYIYGGTLEGLGTEMATGGLTAATAYIRSNTDAASAQPDTEVSFPNIQAKYRLDFDWGHLNFAGGYQTFDVVDSGEDFTVNSYVLGLGARVNVGKAYFKGNVWGGQNVGNLADIFVNGQVFSTYANAADTEKDGAGIGLARFSDGDMYNNTGGLAGNPRGITDNDALAALIVAGYEIRKGLYLEAGYGYTQTELDEDGSEKLDCKTWYVQSTIFFAENVFITPEIGGLDAADDTEVFYCGIKWQINF